MPDEHEGLVRGTYAAWNAGDFDAAISGFDPEVEWSFSLGAQFPDSEDVYHGHEGVRRFWREFVEPWEEVELVVEDMRSAGDIVLVFINFRTTGAGSGIALDSRFFHVIEFRGDKAIRFQAFADRAAAFAAAGIADD